MSLVHIILVFFGIYVHITEPQVYPQGKVIRVNNSTKATEENNKANLEHINPENHPIIAKIPRSGQQSGVNTSLSKNTSNNQVVTHNLTFNGTANPSNIGIQKIDQTLEDKTDELTSGAITRGILVFVALSFLFILYVGIKTYRRKNQDKRRTIITKYGVRARRSDIEMEPLPLSDDEEDETVFDLTANRGNISNS